MDRLRILRDLLLVFCLAANLIAPSDGSAKQTGFEETSESLSREEAKSYMEAEIKASLENIKTSRASEWKSKVIEMDGLKMKFEVLKFGEKPKTGHSLFISMHGGGGAPARVNEQQWRNQIRLYEPEEGIYLVPRAPTDTWNLWHQSHIDKFFGRIIEDAIAFEDVNPNRVYIMGYSAGGDGVYQLAPRMADQLAAAAMMAGHPNDASPLGLRNIGFTLHMGGKDSAYKRNEVAAQWKEKLAELRESDPKGYAHEVTIHPDHGHWMKRDDAVAVPWMGKFTRNPLPEKIVWLQSGVTHDRYYWLAADKADQKKNAKMVVSREGNTFTIEETDQVEHVVIRLNDDMIDFSKPVTVKQGSHSDVFQVSRNKEVIQMTIAGRSDPGAVFSSQIRVKIK